MFSVAQISSFLLFPVAFMHYEAENYARLQQLKKRYDPENCVRHPQSVHLPGSLPS